MGDVGSQKGRVAEVGGQQALEELAVGQVRHGRVGHHLLVAETHLLPVGIRRLAQVEQPHVPHAPALGRGGPGGGNTGGMDSLPNAYPRCT